MKELIRNIEQWAGDRNIIKGATPQAQFIKLVEETGELAAGLARSDKELIQDSLGDCMVVLIILARQLGYSLEDCLSGAYDEIKDRRGRMINGVFVKEEDL